MRIFSSDNLIDYFNSIRRNSSSSFSREEKSPTTTNDTFIAELAPPQGKTTDTPKESLNGFTSESIKGIKVQDNGSLDITYSLNGEELTITGRTNEEQAITELTINGKKIDLSKLPIKKESLDAALNNLILAVENIEKNKDVNALITKDTQFSSPDGYNIFFSVKDGEESLSYMSSREDLFKVINPKVELTEAEEAEYESAKKEYQRLERKYFVGELNPYPYGSAEARAWSKQKEAEREKIKDEIAAAEIKLEAAIRKMSDLSFKKDSIELEGSKGNKVSQDAPYGSVFSRRYYDSKGNVTKIERSRISSGSVYLEKSMTFNKDKSTTTTIYDRKGNIIKVEVRNGENDLQHTDHYENGEIVYRESSLETYTVNGSKQNKVFFAFIIDGKTQFLNPFDQDFKSKVGMEPIEFLALHLDTKEKFDQFESSYRHKFSNLKYLHGDEKSLVISIRGLGKKLYGVDKLEKEIEELYKELGLKIEVETEMDWSDSYYKTSAYTVKELKKQLLELQAAIEMYPPQFLLNSGINKLYILRDFKGKESNAGGYFKSSNGNIFLSGITSTGRGSLPIELVFHHELRHAADHTDGGLYNENSDWQNTFHPTSSVYGKYLKVLKGKYGSITFPLDDKGFRRSYGRLNINEDQATMSESLFTSEGLKKVLAKGEKEPLVLEKLKRTKLFYLRISNGRMDDKFWEDVENNVVIDISYWKKREANGDFDNETAKRYESYTKINLEIEKRAEEINTLTKDKKFDEIFIIYLEAAMKNPTNSTFIKLAKYNYFEANNTFKGLEEKLHAFYLHRLESLPEEEHMPSYYSDLARSYFEKGEANKAIETYDKAITKFPNFTDAKTSLRNILKGLIAKEADEEKKKELTSKLILIATDIFNTTKSRSDLIALINANNLIKDNDANIKASFIFLAGNFSDKGVREYLEKLVAKSGQEDKMIEFYTSEIKANPNKLDPIILLANFYMLKLNNFESAKKVLDEAKEKFGNNKSYIEAYKNYYLTLLKNTAGDEEKAKVKEEAINHFSLLFKDKNDFNSAKTYIDFCKDLGTSKQYEDAVNLFIKTFSEQVLKDRKIEFHSGSGNSSGKTSPLLWAYQRVISDYGDYLISQPESKERNAKIVKLYEDEKKRLGEYFENYDELILAYEMNGDYDKGLSLIEEGLKNKTFTRDWSAQYWDRQKIYLELLQSKEKGWSKPNKNGYRYAIAPGYHRTLFIEKNGNYEILTRWAEGGAARDPKKKATGLSSLIYWNQGTSISERSLPDSLKPKTAGIK